MYNYTYTRYLVKFIQIESITVVARGCGEGGMRSYYLMDTEFQFGKMKKFWRWMVVTVVQQCEYHSILNTTELYTKK